MIPKDGEGIIMFKDGKYVGAKFDLNNWPKLKEALRRCKDKLGVKNAS